MESEKFCLKWNDFETNISLAFKELREDKDFFDVTLVCDDEQIKAHKVILSACSQFFRKVLKQNPHQHPLLYLKGVNLCQIKAVLEFMYNGEVNIEQEELNMFLAIADDLKIKGLYQNSTKTRSKVETSTQKQKPSYETNKQKATQQIPQILQEDDEVQEILPVKHEPKEPCNSNLSPGEHPLSIIEATTSHSIAEEEFDEYEGYEDHSSFMSMNSRIANFPAGGASSERLAEFESFLKLNSGQVEGGMWSCFLCGKVTNGSGNMRQHFEVYHFSLGGFQCDHCMKMFKTKHSLATHVSKNHRNR